MRWSLQPSQRPGSPPLRSRLCAGQSTVECEPRRLGAMKLCRWILLLALPLLLPAPPQDGRAAEEQKAGEIMTRARRGETVTAEEREFVKKVNARRMEEFQKANPPRESTGLVPLTELGAGGYRGEEGGLYPGGKNTPPKSHLDHGLALARRIAPLDAEGRRAAEGKIVLLTIGMSNTTQESQAFLKRAAGDPDLNPRLVIVDGAQGGQAADTTANPEAKYWSVVEQRLSAAGVTSKQVQAVWLKQAIIQPSRPFPADARRLQGYLVDTLHNLNSRYPNLKIAYLSSRIYAGYAATPLNPEPHSYESAFAVKWAIADQIAGEPELNYDPGKGAVRAPWLAWGPYLWGDGVKARRDGITWLREDLGEDGTHPSMYGREKVAKLLLDFLKNDPTSRPWFVKGKH